MSTKPMTEMEVVEHLWELYEAAATSDGQYTGPTVDGELMAMFPHDEAEQRRLRDIIVDRDREGLLISHRTCRKCGKILKNKRSRSGHEGRCSL